MRLLNPVSWSTGNYTIYFTVLLGSKCQVNVANCEYIPQNILMKIMGHVVIQSPKCDIIHIQLPKYQLL